MRASCLARIRTTEGAGREGNLLCTRFNDPAGVLLHFAEKPEAKKIIEAWLSAENVDEDKTMKSSLFDMMSNRIESTRGTGLIEAS